MKLYKKIQESIFVEKYIKQVNESFRKLSHKVELSKEQEQQIQDYWQGLVGYKIPTDWHRYFYARTGLFSVKYIPTSLYRLELTGRLNQLPWCVPFSDKNLNDILLPTMKQPHTYLKNRNGYFYVENKAVSLDEAVSKCGNVGGVIIKPTLSSHGSGVKKLYIQNGIVDDKGTKLKDLLVKYGKDFLIQDLVKQHPAMNALNPDSINTIRIVTYRKGMEVFALYAAIRIGRKGQTIDNESAGGISTKINLDGTLCKWAYGAPGQDKIELTDSGIKLEGYIVPSFLAYSIFTCRAKAPAVFPLKMICFFKLYLRLMFHNAKLTDTIVYMNYRISHCYHGNKPLIVISAVALIHNTHMICLNKSKVLISTAPWHDMCLITLRKFYADTKRYKFILSFFKFHFFCCPKVYPV